METHQKFKQLIDPQKAEQNAQQLLSTMSEVQEIFLYLQTHTNLSIIRSLAIVEQHIKAKEGKNLPDLLKPISEEYPELNLLPVYRSAVNHFSRHFPAAALKDHIKAKVAVIEQQDFSQPENRIFLKVKSVDWEKIFTFLENHYFLLTLWKKVKIYHPNIEETFKRLKDEIVRNLNNYNYAKKISRANCLIGKSPDNTGVKVELTESTKEGLQILMEKPIVDCFNLLKDLSLQETCIVEDLEFVLPEVKSALEKIDLNKLSLKKIMLQKLLEFIHVEEGSESIQFLILHDVLQLLYPYRFTSDSIFLQEGPIYNKNGSMDGEVRRKKIREVKMIMNIPVNR